MIGKNLKGELSDFRHLHLDACISTNSECGDAYSRGDPGNLWITATLQNSGRGSRGRQWVSSPGNLFASLLLVNPSEPKHFSGLTFVAAIAVRNSLIELLGESFEENIHLKWPNDVLVDGRKISGILLEGGSNGQTNCVTIGIGVNCKHHPSDTMFPATNLSNYDQTINAEDVFECLTDNVAKLIKLWNNGYNFETIQEMWLKNCVGLGRPVSVQIPSKGLLAGNFETIDKDGFLMLKLPDGSIERISVGDIFFPDIKSEEKR